MSTGDYGAVAKAMVLHAIAFLEDAAACVFCELGHVPYEDDEVALHDEGCPLRGFEMTADVEKLQAWARKAGA